MRFLKSALEPELRESIAAINDFKRHSGVEFSQLWTLSGPEAVAFTGIDGAERAYEVLGMENRASRDASLAQIRHQDKPNVNVPLREAGSKPSAGWW